jgi:hypothetical protein
VTAPAVRCHPRYGRGHRGRRKDQPDVHQPPNAAGLSIAQHCRGYRGRLAPGPSDNEGPDAAVSAGLGCPIASIPVPPPTGQALRVPVTPGKAQLVNDLQYQSRLSARRPAFDVFVHSHANRVSPQRLHLGVRTISWTTFGSSSCVCTRIDFDLPGFTSS